MDKTEFINTGKYFLQLVRCGLDENPDMIPPEKPDGVEWKNLFVLSQKHSLAAVAYCAVQKIKNFPDRELFDKWEHAHRFCIYADIQQTAAYEELREYFGEKQLKLLPLKGLLIKDLYPDRALRQMGDLDILYEKEKFPEIRKGMQELGYTYHTESAGSNHQIFDRKPAINVEMHSDLLPIVSPFYKYYENAWAKAISTDEPYLFRFSKEDEYIFLLLHAYKHFNNAGSGVRTVVDFHLFLRRYRSDLDRTYIAAELDKLDKLRKKNKADMQSLFEFEDILSTLIKEWFNSDEILIDDISLKILSDGVYGDLKNSWQKGLNEKGSVSGYLFGRLFPPYKVMKQGHPALIKCPLLLPFYWIARIFRGFFRKRKTIVAEYKYVKNSQKNDR